MEVQKLGLTHAGRFIGIQLSQLKITKYHALRDRPFDFLKGLGGGGLVFSSIFSFYFLPIENQTFFFFFTG